MCYFVPAMALSLLQEDDFPSLGSSKPSSK